MGCWDENLFKCSGHMTKMASRPIFGKNFQKYHNSSLELQKLSFLLPLLICFRCYNGKSESMPLLLPHCRYFDFFYRNVCWVVLYQTYHFYPNLWIWVVAMPTKRLNLRKIFKINLRCPRYHCPIQGSSEMVFSLGNRQLVDLSRSFPSW